ncbi:alpha/beta hydrolase [Kutzneria viridogrisea]|uniref:Pimeloyl-ACP methyl ester carboxylesterase n=1 Tax=Kutzneria viridogrisea TaxID=47990 RepID=A0ABR6BA75_9PSEU|nr:pimeloyl-ACP methyl ester carboxylesterase [Kutzneria viridogrisea]
MSRTSIGAVTALLLASSGALAAPAAAAEPSADLRLFYDQQPTWAPCDFDATVDCASISAPLDYTRPEGRRITIAISRQRASDPAHRRGVLLSNPGGPGGSGLMDTDAAGKVLSWPKQRFASTPLSKYYDLIGFDPRGVGRSTQLSCEQPSISRPIVSRPTAADFDADVAWAKAAEEGCQRASGEVRPSINTRNTARDMDLIRGVLGERTINYVGYSYGTYLGAVYGSMFANHLDRSVLDSSLPPDPNWRQVGMASALANQQNVESWAEWVGERNSRYGLGRTKADVLATVETTSTRLPSTPESNGFSQQTLFDQTMGFQSTLRSDWPGLAELVRKTRDTGVFTPPAPPTGSAPGASTVFGYIPVNQTIQCETDWPSDLDVYRRDTALFSQRYPYGWGATTAMPAPCTFRSFALPEKATHIERTNYPVGVVVQARADVQTPYAGGAAMAERLGDRLITVADDGNHGQYARRGNPCVDNAVSSYLIDGVLPAPGLTCAGQPRPDLPPDSSAGNGK